MENCLYITGFSNGVSKEELRDFFEGYGKVSRVDILSSRDLESTPYAFVQFQETADFESALAKKSHLCDLAVDPEKGLKVEKAKSAPNLKRDRMLASRRRRYPNEDSYGNRGGYRDHYYDRYSEHGYDEYSREAHPRYRLPEHDERYYRNSYDPYYGPGPQYDYRDRHYNDRRPGTRPGSRDSMDSRDARDTRYARDRDFRDSRDAREYEPDYYRGYPPHDRPYYSSREYSRDYQRDRNYQYPEDYESQASTRYYRDRYPARGRSEREENQPASRPPNPDGRTPVAKEEGDPSLQED